MQQRRMRAIHRCPNADKWRCHNKGWAWMAVFDAGLKPGTTNLNPGDIGCVRCSTGYYVKNAGDINLVFPELLNPTPCQSA